jgi:hypothetical protein
MWAHRGVARPVEATNGGQAKPARDADAKLYWGRARIFLTFVVGGLLLFGLWPGPQVVALTAPRSTPFSWYARTALLFAGFACALFVRADVRFVTNAGLFGPFQVLPERWEALLNRLGVWEAVLRWLLGAGAIALGCLIGILLWK